MRFPLLAVAFLWLVIGSSTARAQDDDAARAEEARIDDVFDRGCGDDDGNDRCASDIQRRMRQLYGLADAESLAEQGVTLRRAMLVDGYGNDVVAITFSRAPGRSPMVEIAVPLKDQADAPPPLAAVVSQDTWDRVMVASQNFDQRLAREQTADSSGIFSLCIHGWFVVAEAVDAARLQPNVVGQDMRPIHIRRDAEGACADGLAVPFAFQLADIALENLSECSSLDLGHLRNKAGMLAQCRWLGGDRIAAGDASKFLETLRLNGFDGLPQGDRLEWDFFAESARDLAAPFRAAVEGGHFYFGAPHAADADHATVEGEILFPIPFDLSPEEREGRVAHVADVKLELVRQTGDFVIQSYEISEKRRSP